MHADRLGSAVLGILRQVFLQVLVVQKMMKPYQSLCEYKLVGLFRNGMFGCREEKDRKRKIAGKLLAWQDFWVSA